MKKNKKLTLNKNTVQHLNRENNGLAEAKGGLPIKNSREITWCHCVSITRIAFCW